MGDVVNLRQARKVRARAAKEQVAAENRARSGRDKSQKVSERLQAEAEERKHSGHKLSVATTENESDS